MMVWLTISGDILFENSLIYGDGVLDYILGKDTFFYVSRDIPHKLSRIGRQLAKLFDIRRKFFHFEFFIVGDEHTHRNQLSSAGRRDSGYDELIA
jgi:hypothetical protein